MLGGSEGALGGVGGAEGAPYGAPYGVLGGLGGGREVGGGRGGVRPGTPSVKGARGGFFPWCFSFLLLSLSWVLKQPRCPGGREAHGGGTLSTGYLRREGKGLGEISNLFSLPVGVPC